MAASQALTAGFADPVIEAQAAFHALMQALARPGSVQPLTGVRTAPARLAPTLGAVALTLLDFETSVWLDLPAEEAAPILGWLRFHTGVKVASATDLADFALITQPEAMPMLASFRLGEEAYPDRSTTLILPVAGFDAGQRFRLTGPGIKDETMLAIDGLPATLLNQWAANRALFPRGVDVILAGPDSVVGLPRTTRIAEA